MDLSKLRQPVKLCGISVLLRKGGIGLVGEHIVDALGQLVIPVEGKLRHACPVALGAHKFEAHPAHLGRLHLNRNLTARGGSIGTVPEQFEILAALTGAVIDVVFKREALWTAAVLTHQVFQRGNFIQAVERHGHGIVERCVIRFIGLPMGGPAAVNRVGDDAAAVVAGVVRDRGDRLSWNFENRVIRNRLCGFAYCCGSVFRLRSRSQRGGRQLGQQNAHGEQGRCRLLIKSLFVHVPLPFMILMEGMQR